MKLLNVKNEQNKGHIQSEYLLHVYLWHYFVVSLYILHFLGMAYLIKVIKLKNIILTTKFAI
jgi:hypothetical protein